MRALRMARDGRDDESDVRDQHRNTDEVSEHEADAMESIRERGPALAWTVSQSPSCLPSSSYDDGHYRYHGRA
jgi:hypothetical protein